MKEPRYGTRDVRAITFTDRLRFDSGYPDPQPAVGECVVRVHMAGLCATDMHITHGYMHFSGVLGHEMVGTVVEGSSEWRDRRVVCEINCVCRQCEMCLAGLSNHCRKRTVLGIDGRDGCFADLVAVPERNLHVVTDSISDEEAVFVEPLAAAYQVLKQVTIEARSHVAVVGSGKLGLLIAQVLATTGCNLEVIGRNPKTLLFCEKKRIRSTSITDLIARNDRDVVIECTGSPSGLDIALELVRPRGTIVLKSTYAGESPLNLAPAVVNEVTILGSRCGPFVEAMNALARRDIDVSSMVAKAYRIDRGLDAFEAVNDPNNIKILLQINPR